MSSLKLFFKCFYSPSLYMIYRDQNYTGKYTPDKWERIGDLSLSTAGMFWKLGLYSSPLLAAFFYRKGYMNAEGAMTFTRITLWFGVLVGASYCIRSYGRATNSFYRNFLNRLSSADSVRGVLGMGCLELLDKLMSNLDDLNLEDTFLCRHKVVEYAGVIGIKQPLIDGRRTLVMNKNGVRYKLKTPEGNTVDSMFVDRRDKPSISGTKRGKTLVICSDGNSGFYEVGIMGTAIDSQFSVLGWNHPGFGGSTGTPYMPQEESAINTVMEFAIQRLGFSPEDIVLYCWSIGGYVGSWASAAYPSVRTVVVDAGFDELLPLAINHMPSFLESVVRVTVRSYTDLNAARLLFEYPGTIKLVRRSDDEVIALVPGDLSSNRGNDLLRKVLKRRYPQVISDLLLSEWLALTGFQKRKLEESKNVDKEMCQSIIDSYVTDHGPDFPMSELGKGMEEDIKDQITIYLAGKYMTDYVSTHCEPLPSDVFVNLLQL